MRDLDRARFSGYINSPMGGPLLVRLSDVQESVCVKGEMTFPEESLQGVNAKEPVFFELTLSREGEGFSLRGPISFSLGLTCSRCLKEFKRNFEVFVDLKLMPEVEMCEEELELRDEDMETAFFKGDEVDLAPFIWEEMMLCVPIKPLCTEDCRGICPLCGRDRNCETCECTEEGSSLLGEKLKKFLNL